MRPGLKNLKNKQKVSNDQATPSDNNRENKKFGVVVQPSKGLGLEGQAERPQV